MLHLLPIKWVLTFCLALGALGVFGAIYLGWAPEDHWFANVQAIIRWSTGTAIALPILFYLAWRFVPLIQSLIFPYLGGHWNGHLQFSGKRGVGRRRIKLTIDHTPLSLKMFLDSKESFSKTLAVHAERTEHAIVRKRLYYVYLNERKEGFPGAGQTYRGLAIMSVENRKRLELRGDYFTEEGQAGTLTLSRYVAHPFWTFWK
ncbi:MAG: hypothetical protein JWO45_1229 [Spartobacteria bacterium]|nr:hypothetical protein [Spartobacteria bacterium]